VTNHQDPLLKNGLFRKGAGCNASEVACVDLMATKMLESTGKRTIKAIIFKSFFLTFFSLRKQFFLEII